MTVYDDNARLSNALGEPTQRLQLPPDPRIAQALGLHHRLETAIADLIDNSIDAGASNVWIRLVSQEARLNEILVVDNGSGMNQERLARAFVLGAPETYDAGRLGHFGVGLKASAFSQADVLTVISRSAEHDAVALRTQRAATDALAADVFGAAEAARALETNEVPFAITTGTVIRLTGIRTASQSDDESIRTQWLFDRINMLREHLGLVFHRFLESGRLTVTIDVWDSSVGDAGVPYHPTPVDPFGVRTGKLGYPRVMVADLPDGKTLSFAAHILAPGVKSRESDIAGRARADWQGVYVFRNDRLLGAGGWGDVTKSTADLQLARVSVDITTETLEFFGMNAEKDGVSLRPELVHALQRSGDEDVAFRDYLQDAKDVLRQANRRVRAIKPLAPMGSGFSRAVEDFAGDALGFRESDRSVSVKWMPLRAERIFLVDVDRAIIWLNEKHRDALSREDAAGGVDFVTTTMFLLLESFFRSGHLQQVTIDQLDAWNTMLAIALGVTEQVTPGLDDEETSSTGPARTEPTAVPPRVPASAGDAADDDTRETQNTERGPVPVAQRDDSGSELRPRFDHLPQPTTDGLRDYLKQIARFPLLRAEEEVELAQDIEAGVIAEDKLAEMTEQEKRSRLGRELDWISRNGRRATDKLATSNLRLVVSIAKQHQNSDLDLLDLIQEGNSGLLRAVMKFDYTKGFKFSTYATWWIRQAITRGIADRGSTIRIPVHMEEVGAKIRAARTQLSTELGRLPRTSEIASAIEAEPAKVELYLRMTKPIWSLNSPVLNGSWNDPDSLVSDEWGAPTVEVTEFGASLIDDSDPIEGAIAAIMLEGQIDAVLGALDDRSARVLSLRFGLDGNEPLTLDAIGDEFGVTRERIRQIEAKALRRLREPAMMQRLFGQRDVSVPEVPAITTANVPELKGNDAPIPQATPVADGVDDAAVMREEFSEFLDAYGAIIPDESITEDEPLDDVERAWTPRQLHDLYMAYRSTRHVRDAAHLAGVDERDAAVALTRLLLWENGPIEDYAGASRHGTAWTQEETQTLLTEWATSTSLREIAASHQRTQLAIGWRLLNNTAKPVSAPDRFTDVDRLAKRWTDITSAVLERNAHVMDR